MILKREKRPGPPDVVSIMELVHMPGRKVSVIQHQHRTEFDGNIGGPHEKGDSRAKTLVDRRAALGDEHDWTTRLVVDERPDHVIRILNIRRIVAVAEPLMQPREVRKVRAVVVRSI